MRLLKFNNEFIDIDDSTAIGIDVQAFDIKNPSTRKVNISNNFTIPKTAHNLNILGHAGNPQSVSSVVYSKIDCQYWVDGLQLINGKANVIEIGDRIGLYVINSTDIWDLLKEFSFADFQSEYLDYLHSEFDYSIETDVKFNDFTDFVSSTINDGRLLVSYYLGNLFQYNNIEGTENLYLNYNGINGGHFSASITSIFAFLEYKYDVNFGVTETFDYNIFQDYYAGQMFIPLRNITALQNSNGFYFKYVESQFAPHDVTKYCDGKSVFDLITSFFKHFNCIVDNGTIIKIRRFDDIQNAEILELEISKTTAIFKPQIENYKQENYIKFTNHYKGASDLLNSKKIVCENKNILKGGVNESLFEIDAFVNSRISESSNGANISDIESFETFSFFTTQLNVSVTINMSGYSDQSEVFIIPQAELYSLDSEYNTIQNMVLYPVVYTVKKWFNIYEIHNIEFFKRYLVRELNGYYFINKISGFNPDKSTEPTTLELIKIPYGN